MPPVSPQIGRAAAGPEPPGVKRHLSLSMFIVPVSTPPGYGEVFEVGLTQHHLYLIGATSRVFSAPAPTAPRER
jgi:hypothetical protein